MPNDPAGTVRAMRVCRDAMIEVCRCVKPTEPAYHAASMVISAIDAMATFLTGERYYFSAHGSVTSEGARQLPRMILCRTTPGRRQRPGSPSRRRISVASRTGRARIAIS